MVQVRRYGSGSKIWFGSKMRFGVKYMVRGQSYCKRSKDMVRVQRWFEVKDMAGSQIYGSRSKIWLVVKDMVRGQRYG